MLPSLRNGDTGQLNELLDRVVITLAHEEIVGQRVDQIIDRDVEAFREIRHGWSPFRYLG
ncbi:hypothetical protein GCM10009828_041420 [Actinoplanes couchii]|uniref:Uncharacterized protein n=1 Tax=Actinoplanes couchii TaxID=403638 RepID=A0ABQ3XCV3_9ACTN|nr:hypothetical protein Aco03nite_047150 [Actinoplanes couchii]